MALDKQVIPVEFKTGLNTKIADQLQAGQFDVLENCVRRKYGRIDKRTGYSALGTNLGGTTTDITNGIKLDTYNQFELLQFDGQRAYSYSITNNKWVDRGSAAVVATTTDNVVRNNAIQYSQDVAFNSGISAYIYSDSRGGVRASVYQVSDETPLLLDSVLDSTGDLPRVVAVGRYIYFMYRKVANMVVKRIAVSDPTTISLVSSALVSDMATGSNSLCWSVDVYDPMASAIVAYSTATATKIFYFLEDGTVGTTSSGYPNTATAAERSDQFNAVKCDPDRNRIWLIWYSSIGGPPTPVRLFGLTSNFVTSAASTIVSTTYGGASYAQQATIELNSSGYLEIFLTLSNATATFATISKAVYSWPVGTASFTVISATATFKRGVILASRAFITDDEIYVLCLFPSTAQPTFFLIRSSDGIVVAREFPGTAGDGTGGSGVNAMLSFVYSDETLYTTPVQIVSRVAIVDGDIQASWKGLASLQMRFADNAYRGVSLGQVYHLEGGMPKVFDGQTFTEEGFNYYPEIFTAPTATTGGSLENDTSISGTAFYYLSVIYEWVDAQGNITRSAPSIVSTVAMGASNTKITVVVPTLRLTEKTGTRADVKVVVFRGIVNQDAVLYRDAEATNDVTANTVTIALTQSDASVSTKEILYTTGGVLENLPSPPSTIAVIYKNRLVLAGLENPNEIAYSKAYQPGESVAFNDGLRFQVDPIGGDITALGVLDDKLVIFKKGRILVMAGDGPLDTGAQNDFTPPLLISSDVGCDNPESIVIVPDGVMFKSTKGIRLLDRNLGVQPVGQEADDFNDLTITSAILLGDTEEVRWTSLEGTAIVYNYRFQQWSTFLNYAAVSSTKIDSAYYHLKPSTDVAAGLVMLDNDGYLDNGARYRMAIETSWFAFSGLQGYQRIYRLACLGDFVSDHYTVTKLAYDYEPAFNETIYFNVDDGLDLSYYGDDPTYGESTVYGGAGSGVYQFSIKPRKQKCEAIKLRLEDIDTKTAAGGGSFNFVSLSFEVGVKKPLNKMTGSKRIGSL